MMGALDLLMEAPVVEATPAPEAPKPAAKGNGKVKAAPMPEPAVEPELPEPPAEAEPAAEETPAEGEPEAETPPEPEAVPTGEDLFTEEALASPEGIAAARKAVRILNETAQAERRKLSGTWAQFNKRQDKFRAKLEEFRATSAAVQARAQQIDADMRLIRSGKPEQQEQALQRLAGGVDVQALLRRVALGKYAKDLPAEAEIELNPVVAEMREQLQVLRMEREATQRAEQQRTAQETVKRDVLAAISGDDSEYPLLAAKVAEHGEEQIYKEIHEFGMSMSRQLGRGIDKGHVLAEIERRLWTAQGGKPSSLGLDAGTETRPAAKPKATQRTPGSLSPRITAADGATRRPKTEDELIREVADSLPDDWFPGPRRK